MRDFHNSDHANNRLSRCFMAYKNDDGTFLVTRIAGATKEKIVTNCGREFPIKSDKIVLLFPKLGYVNTRHQCAYVTRSSRRMWKVGLTPENIIVDFLFRNKVTGMDDMGIGNMLASIINDKYPKATECLKAVQDKRVAAQAFSRKFCFGRHHETLETVLYYKNKSVGYYDKNLEALVISDTNSHMVQQVLEAMGDDKLKVLV